MRNKATHIWPIDFCCCFFKDLLFIIYLLIYFWLCRVLVAAHGVFVAACRIFSCGMWALCCSVRASPQLWHVVFLFSSCGAQAQGRVGSVVVVRVLESVGSAVCGTQPLQLRRASSVAVVCGPSCPVACGILVPLPGIEPASPALEGGFFTTGPPGKSLAK